MQDEPTTVNGLAASLQAACNASSTLRMCHLLPIELTAAPAQPQDSSEAVPDGCAAAILSGTLLGPAAPLKLTQLNRMRVLECMLYARLMRPAACEGAAGDAFRSGLLSIEQSRALVPLLHSDPMVRPGTLYIVSAIPRFILDSWAVPSQQFSSLGRWA